MVKADGYGHGALDCASAALAAGASALCVATVAEALALRPGLPSARILVLGPAADDELRRRARRGSSSSSATGYPTGIPVHVKLDTGMGRWGVSELPAPGRQLAGVMTHLATADSDPAFARLQLARFLEATEGLEGVTRHAANSAAALGCPSRGSTPAGSASRSTACRPSAPTRPPTASSPCSRGGARSRSVACCPRASRPATDARFLARAPTWIGIVPVGYADGFRRDLSGTEVLVSGRRRRVVGAVSMDAFAVELDGPPDAGGAGDARRPGCPARGPRPGCGHDHLRARHPDRSQPTRARRLVVAA